MKILSVKQPWAWLIVNGHKNIENRTWYTIYRGPLLIHTGTHLEKDVPSIRRVCLERGITLPESFERGGIVGQAHLRDIVLEHASPWFDGPYGWVLTDGKPLPFIPLRGRLGLFQASDELMACVSSDRK